jgi:anti-sigma factor RsiW
VNCRDCAEFLADYLSGELAADVRATFERHLTRCPNCATYLEQYRATIEAGKAAFESEPVEDFPEELIRAILSTRATRPPD